MCNRCSRIVLLSILILSFSLTACQPEAVSSPTVTQSHETHTPTLTKTPSPSQTPTAAISSENTPTATPAFTPTQTAYEISLARTPLPELMGQINLENINAITALAIWGSGRPNGISLSSDGQVLAVATNLGATFYDSESYTQLALIHTSLPVKAVAFSVDNLRIALGLADGSIEIIDRGNFSALISLNSPYSYLADTESYSLSYSSNSDELFQVIETTGGILVHRWETSTWQTITSFSLEPSWTAYSSASLDLLGVITDEQLTLQSLKYTEEYDILDLPSSIAQSFWTRMVNEGGEVAAASTGEFILISNGIAIAKWELLSDEYSYLLDDYPNHIPDPCSQAPNTCLNASGGFSWSCVKSATLDPIELIALSPDDYMVLISRNDNLTEFRRESDNLMLWEIEASFTDIAFSPGGEFFFGVRPDGTIEKRTTLDGTLIDLLNLHSDRLYSIAFSPDGSVIAAGFSDSWVRVFSAGSGEILGVLTGTARSLQFSPDGALLAAGLEDGTVRIFLLEEGEYYDINPGHLAAVTDLTFSSSGELLLTGSADCTTSLWNVSENYRIQTQIPGDDAPFRVNQVLFGRDLQTEFISGNLTGITTLTRSNEVTSLLPEMEILDLALSPDGIYLAAAGENLYLISMPESERSNLVQLDEDQTGISYAATFDPMNTLLADATLDEIRFWSVENAALIGKIQIADFVSPDNPPVSLTFSPNRELVLLATADGLIQVFGIPTGAGN